MHSALFVAKVSNIDPMKWGDFLVKANVRQTGSGVSRLAENVWLVNFQESPVPLASLVLAADAHGFSYGILPFEHAPEWLPVGFDPKTI